MPKLTLVLLLSLAVAAVAAEPPSRAAGNRVPAPPAPAAETVRELFVRFDELGVILESGPRRVLLTREEFDDLARRAKQVAQDRAPIVAVLAAADYRVTLADERARISGTLAVSALEDGLTTVPLELGSVGLVSATLDGKGAAIGRADDGRWLLFVDGKGQHELKLEMVAPVETTAARQIVRFQAPTPPATRMVLATPGDVELKSGAAVVTRTFDAAASRTEISLLPPRGPMTLVLSLNSHLRNQGRLVVARSVVLDEVTRAYERLHATVSMSVLHAAVNSFAFAVPEGFEITEVASPHVSRWALRPGKAGARVLEVTLREDTTDTVVLSITGLRISPDLASWKFPRLEPRDVVSHMSVVGLVLEDRLKAEGIAPEDLLPIDVAVLKPTLPASALGPTLEGVLTRPVVAYYAPHSAYALAARFVKPPAEVTVTGNVLLTLSDRGHDARASFVVMPQEEKLFELDVTVPPGWQVSQVTGDGDAPLPFERFGDPAPVVAGQSPSAGPAPAPGAMRIHVRFPRGVAVGTEARVTLAAARTPADWLDEWTETKVAMPEFAVSGATRDVGAVAVEARDDMLVRPDQLAGLTRLARNEMTAYGLGTQATMAYRYDARPYAAAFAVRRVAPRMTARTFNLFRVERDTLVAHQELEFEISAARARRLVLELPKDTPEKLSITGLGGATVKEFHPEVVGDVRRWTAQLKDGASGTVRLAVDFEQRREGLEHKNLALPIVRAAGVDYQSGFVSVEGDPELDVRVSADALRKVDVGELVDASQQPGRRLLGVWSFVGDRPVVTMDAALRDPHELPTAIAQQAVLRTALAEDGASINDIRFTLTTKAQYLKIVLPEGAEFWSAMLDDRPTQPQRDGQSLLVSLGETGIVSAHSLRVVYSAAIGDLGLWTRQSVTAPRLSVHTGPDREGSPVPVVDLVWHLHMPQGHRVVRSEGSVVTSEVVTPPLAVAQLPGQVLALGGGAGFDRSLVGLIALPTLSRVKSSDRAMEFAGGYAHDVAMKDAPKDAVYHDEEAKPADDTFDTGEDRETPRRTSETGRRYGGVSSRDGKKDLLSKTLEGAEVAEAETTRTTPEAKPAEAPATPAKETRDLPHYTLTPGIGDLPQKAPAAQRRSDLVRWSLLMAVEPSAELGPAITFTNLGENPVLDIVTMDERRTEPLAWSLAGAVLLAGLAQVQRSVSRKVAYILLVAVVATLIPVLSGCMELTIVTNPAFDAAALLAPLYLAIGLGRWIVRRVREHLARRGLLVVPSAAATLLVTLLALAPVVGPAEAQQAPASPYVIQVVDPGPPPRVPEDAVIVPYEGDVPPAAATAADKLLVSYDRFVELWNQAYPQKKIGDTKPPANFALAGAAFRATLAGDEFLLVEGNIDLDVYVGGYVEVPLALAGGVLARADLDGRPARLGLAEVVAQPMTAPVAEQQRAQQAKASPQQAVGPAPQVLVAYVSGKGRHRLDLTVRLKMERRGGWRVIEGQLPAAPATELRLTVPDSATEVRLGGVRDRAAYETKAAGETIATAVEAGQALSVQWRPKIGEAQVDRGLAVDSAAVVEVREDRIGVTWRMNFSFPRGQRDSFTFSVPEGYVVEKVDGSNVRGWQASAVAGRTQVTVSLLKAAKDSDSVAVTMWRSESFPTGKKRSLALPTVEVAEAIRHSGTIAIQRSPLLDLRLASSEGVTRVDLAGGAAARSEAPAGDNPLGLRDWQSYRFAASPLAITLDVEPVAAWAEASTESLLKIAERLRTLETRVVMHVRDQPLYRVELLVPSDLKVESVLAPGEFEWAVRAAKLGEDRPWAYQELTIYLATGQMGDAPIVVRGRLGDTKPVEAVAVPRVEVLGVRRQTGELVVQVDPAFDVSLDPATTRNLESVPLGRTYGWLTAEQRPLARLALSYQRADVAGRLVLTRRTPTVSCTTVSNVRVTDRSLVETVLLSFDVERAGINEVAFRLPESMKAARISVPGLRLKTVLPPKDGWVEVRLELEDEVIGQIRVLVEDDRLLSTDSHEAPIPVVLTGTTEQRYVAVESAGRDEVEVAAQVGVEALERQSREFGRMAGLLSGGTTQAFLVSPGATQPRLAFRTRVRALVETVAARIGLANTTLIVDAGGAYRGQVIYRVDNRTEQYLEIALPQGAKLWTARVDGQPVKPVDPPGDSAQGHVPVPLVKTADGDLDYEVVLVYAGQMGEPGRLAKAAFPLVRTVNVPVELSQVELMLPEDVAWLDFGGTMTRTDDADDLKAGVIDYWNRQSRRVLDATRSANPYAQTRAKSNLKALQEQARTYGTYANETANDFLVRNVRSNEKLQNEIQERLQELEKSDLSLTVTDNADSLRESYRGQYNNRATNIVQDSGVNFLSVAPQGAPQEAGGKFRGEWLEVNKLADQKKAAEEQSQSQSAAGDAYSKQSWEGRQQMRRNLNERQPQSQMTKGKPSAPQTVDEAQFESLDGQANRSLALTDQRAMVQRYEQRLQEQVQSQPMPVLSGVAGVGGPRGGQDLAGGRALTWQYKADHGLADNGRAGFYGWTDVEQSTTAPATGLASLTDVTLPRPTSGYRTYRFTTPQGDVEITARAVSVRTVNSAERLGLLAVVIVLAWWVRRLIRRRSWSGIAPRLASTILIVAGAAGLLFGLTPVFALAALVGGIAWKVTLRLRHRAEARAAA